MIKHFKKFKRYSIKYVHITTSLWLIFLDKNLNQNTLLQKIFRLENNKMFDKLFK